VNERFFVSPNHAIKNGVIFLNAKYLTGKIFFAKVKDYKVGETSLVMFLSERF